MSSLFDQIDATAQAALTSVFGDDIRIVPVQVRGNYGGSSDAARSPVSIKATFSSAPKAGALDYPNTSRDGAPGVLALAELWIDRAQAAAIGYLPTRNDKIEISGSAEHRGTYTVAHVEPGDHGDLRVILVK